MPQDPAELKRTIVDAHKEGFREALRLAKEEKGRTLQERPNLYAVNPTSGETGTPGELFARSDELRDWLARFPEGGPASGGNYESDPIPVENGLRAAIGARALVGTPSAAGLISPDRFGLLDGGLLRPLTVRQLLTIFTVDSNAAEYVRELSREAAAETVAEATDVPGSGLKPEGGVVFQTVTSLVRTFAEWVAVAQNALKDATQLESYINGMLTYDIGLALENQVIAGDGVGTNFLGILNTPGIQTLAAPVAPAQALDNLRKARTLVKLNGRTDANAILLNPADAQGIELLKDDELRYLAGAPFETAGNRVLWGLPVVESDVMPAGTGLVGDFSKAILFDREQTTLAIGTANDDFVRNIVRIRGEARAAFGVIRPSAFVAVDLV